jgi:DNA-binding MarR family transcriptional regulator
MSHARRKLVPRQWIARWKHESLFGGSYLPVPDSFFKLTTTFRPKVTATQALLLLHLMSYKWREGAPWVAYETLGQRLGISAKQVTRLMKRLERDGYVQIEERSGRTNRFILDGFLDALHAAVDREAIVNQTESGDGARRVA